MQNIDLTEKLEHKKHKNLLSHIKMGKEILTLGDIEIEKNKFRDADIEKVLVSSNIYSGEKDCKYFVGYLYNDNKVKPLHIMLTKTSAYVKDYDRQTK